MRIQNFKANQTSKQTSKQTSLKTGTKGNRKNAPPRSPAPRRSPPALLRRRWEPRSDHPGPPIALCSSPATGSSCVRFRGVGSPRLCAPRSELVFRMGMQGPPLLGSCGATVSVGSCLCASMCRRLALACSIPRICLSRRWRPTWLPPLRPWHFVGCPLPLQFPSRRRSVPGGTRTWRVGLLALASSPLT